MSNSTFGAHGTYNVSNVAVLITFTLFVLVGWASFSDFVLKMTVKFQSTLTSGGGCPCGVSGAGARGPLKNCPDGLI